VRARPSLGFGSRWADLLWAAALLAGAVLYLTRLPRNLSPADESVYLYEAKRVLEGQVPYRDFFEITTPGWMYLMAFFFRLFGTNLETARLVVAVMHGVTAVLVYLTCRRLRVRPGLSWVPAAGYLVVCPWAWPIASQHWLVTMLSVLLLWVCAGCGLAGRAGRLFAAGLVVGMLIAVHQQRGVIIGAGVFTWLILDRAWPGRHGSEAPFASVLSELGRLVVGAAVVVVPLCIFMIASAGFDDVWRALVVHPLVNYRSTMHCEWGHIDAVSAGQGTYTFPRILEYLPAILLPTLARLAALGLRRRRPDEARRLVLLTVFSLFSVLSIAYYPDFIHIAFIAPVFFVAAGENLEWAVRVVPVPRRILRAIGWAAAAALLAACGVRLERNLLRARAAFPYTRQTAFGRVDFASRIEAELYDRVNGLMDGVPSRQLFCYPIMSYLYLMADADNPTRYQFFLAGYNSQDQMREALRVLRARRLPYLVLLPSLLHRDDPILSYARRRYRPMTSLGRVGRNIFRRVERPADESRGDAEKPG
jgi:hypothetical protein